MADGSTRIWSGLGALGGTAVLVGCVLVVSPETYGDHCKLAVETTACGACLRDRCESPIDACCSDSGCGGGALSEADRCAQGLAGACEALAQRRTSPSRFDRELGSCAASACGAVCRTFTGVSETTCGEPAEGRGATCACKAAGAAAANDFECSPASYPGTVCCAPRSWPGEGQECSCRPLGCSATSEGCYCHLVTTPADSQSCEGANCCQIDDQCTCRERCFDGERVVPRCVAAFPDMTSGCEIGQKRVDSCSMRR